MGDPSCRVLNPQISLPHQTMSAAQPPQLSRLFIFTHPRTASNLFCKLFSEHPDLNQYPYPFQFSRLCGPDAQTQVPIQKVIDLCGSETNALSYQAALDKVQINIADSEAKGKIPCVKEHCIYIANYEQVKETLGNRYRETTQKPHMVDKMLDIPEQERENSNAALELSNPNPTIFPDRFLQTFTPVIIIRHPAKQVQSWHKSMRVYDLSIDQSEFELGASYKFPRRVFDYYIELYRKKEESDTDEDDVRKNQNADRMDNNGDSSHVSGYNGSKMPIVIDGDDVIDDAKGIATKFCEITGVDSSGIIYSWEEEKAMKNPGDEFFLETLSKSRGVIQNPSPRETLNIVQFVKKWEEDWGEDVASGLTRYAQDAMADYEYLYQFRLRS